MTGLELFFLQVFFFIVAELLRPKPDIPNADPAGVEDLDFPTAKEGRPVTVIFGRVLVSSPNCVWYGDLVPEPMTEKVKTGLFSSERVIVGYRYYVGMHLVLCSGAAGAMRSIRFAETIVWEGEAMDEIVHVDAETIFGGDETGGEGGIKGDFEILSGKSSQPVNDYLERVIERPAEGEEGYTGGIPAYRGYTSLIMRGVYIGTSPYIKPIAVELERYPNVLDSSYPRIGVDANPAEILYEVMTSTDWGMARNSGEFEINTYLAAAVRLYEEGFGLSYKWGGLTSYDQITQMILTHIDGVMFTSLFTGKFRLNLVRPVDDPALLPRLHPGNIRDLTNFTRGAFDETVNEVKVTFTSRANDYTESTAISQDLANWRVQGRVVSMTENLPAIYSEELASKVALRNLKRQTYPLASLELSVNRQAFGLLLSDAFRLDWPELGITNMVFRVGKVGYGTLTDGQMTINAVQDVFSLSAAVYGKPPLSAWSDPAPSATQSPYQMIEEATHFALYPMVDQTSNTYVVGSTDGRYVPFMARPPGALGYDLYERTGSAAYELAQAEIGFDNHALVETPLAPAADRVRIKALTGPQSASLSEFTATTDERLAGFNLAWIGGEWVSFEALTDLGGGVWELIGLWRGVLDTVPPSVEHPVDTSVWLIPEGHYLRERAFSEGVTVNAKALAFTRSGKVALDTAVALSTPMAARPYRPYPPGNLKVNGARWPDFYIEGQVTLTWSHRDRTNQPLTVRRQTDASNYGPEPGTTYRIRIYNESGALLRTVTGLTGTSYVYDIETERGDTGGAISPALTFELESMRDGYPSWEFHKRTIRREPLVGYGTFYGQYYGGAASTITDPGGDGGGDTGGDTITDEEAPYRNIQVSSYHSGEYLGVWRDYAAGGPVYPNYPVSSTDGVTWTTHTEITEFKAWGRSFGFANGLYWLMAEKGARYASSLDGPWTKTADLPVGSHLVNITRIVNNRVFVYLEELVSTVDGVNWVQHSMPPILDPDRSVQKILFLEHNGSAYVAVVEEGEINNSTYFDEIDHRLWRSTDLINWTEVTPPALQGTTNPWYGRLAFENDLFVLSVALDRRNSTGPRTVYASSGGTAWSEGAFSEPLPDGYALMPAAFDGTNYIIWNHPNNWEYYGQPVLLTSTDAVNWLVSYKDPSAEFVPDFVYELVAGPSGLLGYDVKNLSYRLVKLDASFNWSVIETAEIDQT